ncbi:very short patch repair endonuclease [Hyphomonas sp. GM-8P]|uniref:very short patch repair endonuclease n=1 Tax=Hyphomonas sp. GM-8P TaxID=1280945 RepID=UPI001F1CD407
MAAIKGKDTKPELIIRKGLHARGFRYRRHDRKLPGRPDLVLPKYHAVIFINGCFWHGHGCALFKWPGTRQKFWKEKISANVARDQRNYASIDQAGWRRAVIWECALKGSGRMETDLLLDRIAAWLSSEKRILKIMGV